MGDTLFGYTIEEDDGGLVITVRGSLANGAVRELRERLEGANALPVMSLLSPLVPIGRLLSAPVRLQAEGQEGEEVPAIDEGALSQQIDQTYADFQRQMDEFREAMLQLKDQQSGQE